MRLIGLTFRNLIQLMVLGCVGLITIFTAPPTLADGSASLLTLQGPIGPASTDYLSKALERGQDRGDKLVVLQIDTPGGLDTSTREIDSKILASPIPVICYVAPSGARAASAGTYILYACHVAAMAPGTNVGAATPIQIGGPLPGLPTQKPKEERESDVPTLEDKLINDSVAYIRSLAELSGRNAEWAEKAVREAASIPASEALELRVIDFVASDVGDLLEQIDGLEVRTKFGIVALDTKGLSLARYDPDWRTKILSIITNPNVAYILLLIGIYGLILEFYNPGTLVPGITGVISLFLALYALNLLPINYTGLALIGLGAALMVAEAFAPSFGALGLGGAAAFVIGSILLLDTDVPGFEVSRTLVGSIAVVSSGLFLVVMLLLLRSRRRIVVTGMEEMIASRGEVLDWNGCAGHVRVHGEIWKAQSDQPLEPGASVSVRSIDGLTVLVEPSKKREAQ